MSAQEPNIAAIVPAFAAPLVTGERQIPSLQPGEVLIRNHAIGINPIDWKRHLWGFMIPSYPMVLGSDVSGVVSEVGASVTSVKPGDRVVGYADSFVTGNDDHAAFQTYTVVSADLVTKIPGTMEFAEAASFPLGVCTAVITLFDVLGLPRPVGDSYSTPDSSSSPHAILVWGAASNVGFMTIQVARKAGFTVFATASERHHARLLSLGVTAVVDYKSPNAAEDLLTAAEKAGTQITYAVDAISEADTIVSVMKILSKGTGTRRLAYTLLWPEDVARVDGIEIQHIPGEDMFTRRDDLGRWLFNKALPKWLEEKSIEAIGYKKAEGGLSGIQDAMNTVMKGVSGQRVVVQV